MHSNKNTWYWTGIIFFILSIITCNGYAQLKIMPLGNSLTYDNNSGDTRPNPSPLRVAYREKLYDLLDQAGYNFDFVGSESVGEPTVPDGDNAGFPGINAAELATLLETGIINQGANSPLNYTNNAAVTSGAYLDHFEPDVILLHIGTNDVATTTATDIADILDEVDAYESRASKTVVVFVARIIREVPNDPSTQTLNNALSTMVNTRIGTGDDLVLVNMETGAGLTYALSPAGDMIDAFHPTTAGYEKMADLWFSEIDSYFSAPSITSTAVTAATVGSAYTYDVNATGVPTPTYSLSGTIPTGMTIDANTGIISWTPTVAQLGDHAITVKATSLIDEDEQNFSIAVGTLNDAPTFTIGQDIVIDEDAGPQTNSGWATDIDDGDPELTQTVSFSVTENDNPSLFSSGPSISANGTLTFNTAVDANGVANISIVLMDDGDDSGANTNTSAAETFTVTVNAINDAPSISAIADQTMAMNSTLGPINFTVTDPESEVSALTIAVSSNNQLLIDDSDMLIGGTGEMKTISFTPNVGQMGEAMITIDVNDGVAASQIQFDLVVTELVGISDPVLEKAVSVFPNPHLQKFQIDFSNTLIEGEGIDYAIFDLNGKLYLKDRLESFDSNRVKTIDAISLLPGIYLLQIHQGKKIAIKRIIKL